MFGIKIRTCAKKNLRFGSDLAEIRLKQGAPRVCFRFQEQAGVPLGSEGLPMTQENSRSFLSVLETFVNICGIYPNLYSAQMYLIAGMFVK